MLTMFTCDIYYYYYYYYYSYLYKAYANFLYLTVLPQLPPLLLPLPSDVDLPLS